jgi:hypothetical protein
MSKDEAEFPVEQSFPGGTSSHPCNNNNDYDNFASARRQQREEEEP